MDEMAAMLNEYAGGLQQSFSAVFDRVGQSLAQSAQMMQMMNDVMEAALLQNLRVDTRFDASAAELVVSIANHSQILLRDVTLTVYIDNTTESVDAATVALSTTVVQQPQLPPTAANSTNTRTACVQTFESLSPGEQHDVRVSLPRVPVTGTAELTLLSPGTQAPLCQQSAFRVSLFEHLTFNAVANDRVAIDQDTSAMSAHIGQSQLQQLRRVLRIGPLDAMVTNDNGAYRFTVEEHPYFLSIVVDTGVTYIGIVAARTETDDSEVQHSVCKALMAELELLLATNGA